MKIEDKTVIVLGAGFTKAFLPKAPLLIDNYNANNLMKKYRHFTHAKKILENEIEKSGENKIDIERLMTRLQGQMPYDREHQADHELSLLLSDLKSTFNEKITKAKEGKFYKSELEQFAKVCLLKGVTLITFNYDDILDAALWNVKKLTMTPNPDEPYWHPDGGYGFFCRPASQTIADRNVFMDKANMLLLKLHGSLNWRIKKGYESPYSVDSIIHTEDWLPTEDLTELDLKLIDIHLEKDPFMIPPLLTKDSLIKQPILRLLWSIAYQKLSEAKHIIFVGYSLPISDIATGFLFGESLNKDTKINVVTKGSTLTKKRDIKARYKNLFPTIKPRDFIFENAKDWCKKVVDINSNKINKAKK